MRAEAGWAVPGVLLAHGNDPGRSPWAWDPHLDVALVMVLLGVGLTFAILRIGPRAVEPGEPVVTRRQLVLLGAAFGLLWGFSAWPIHNLAEGFSYTVHMVQHSVYTLVVPPLLILGTPTWLWRWALRPVLPGVRLLARPAVAVIAFSVVTGATHLPVLADSAVRSGLSHFVQHAALLAAALLGWWPLTSTLPEVPRLTWPPWRMAYLLSLTLGSAVLGSFLMWAQAPLYRAYEPYPHLFGLDTLEDQRTGGVVMEWAEAIVLFGVVGAELIRLVRHELRRPRRSAPAPPEAATAPQR